MEIRGYQSRDRASIISLWNDVFPDSTGHNDPSSAIDRKLAENDQLLFVAVENGEPIGTVIAGYDGHRGWLYSLAVSPNHQRRGIGTQLVRHAEIALSRLGCPKINLQVRAENAQVVAFYTSLGYRTEERISMGKLTSDRQTQVGRR